ncbi:NfeD family protein [Enterovirga sp. GCM10030262]|uniref:NfeD family protein n=1 Tax=Enterovirga sp. GCM10030262 TaxID=3273391 RepID=UPI00360CD932
MNWDGIEPHWVWLIGAAVLGIAELLMPGVFLIWLAAAAAITGFAALIFAVPLAFQFALFALLALGAVTFGRRWYASHPVESSDPLLNDRAARLVGETVRVVAAIEGGQGRVKVGDGVWEARGPDAEVGARVRVVGAAGTCLKVEPVATLPAGGGGEAGSA